jgi:hypothetical protein
MDVNGCFGFASVAVNTPWHVSGVLLVFYWCFIGVLLVFYWCFIGVPMAREMLH